MNMNKTFTSVIAFMDTPSRDNRVLSAVGTWTLLAPGPIVHASSGTIVGEMMEMWTTMDDGLVVAGLASPSIAEVLNENTFKLAVDMDEMVKLPTDPYAGIKHFTAGRVRGARLVEASDWLWAL